MINEYTILHETLSCTPQMYASRTYFFIYRSYWATGRTTFSENSLKSYQNCSRNQSAL